MEQIIEQIKAGELTSSMDEKGANGFWDYAGELIFNSNNPDDPELQAEIYYSLWELTELFLERSK